MTAGIRPATPADIDAIAAIYAREVREGYATFATEVPPESRWATQLASTHPGDHFLVAVDGARVVGYAYSGPFRERGAYAHTRESTIYLDPSAAGRGIGRALYGELVDRVAASGARTLLAAVALPNDASEALHRACGFERVGVMREVGRKLDRWIDVAWWQLMLPERESGAR